MKTKFALLATACFMAVGSAHAGYPPYQNRGAVNTSTSIAVSASTTPAILVSTGALFQFDPDLTYRDNVFAGNAGLGASWSGFSSTNSTPGQYLPQRLYMEIFNDTGQDIWIGYSSVVSTTPGVNYGRRISDQSSWSNDGQLPVYWVVASTTTLQKIVVTQQR